MSTTKLLRWSGLASMVAGLLFALATVLHPPGEDVPAMITAAWVPAHAIGWVANLLLLLGLIGLYGRQAEKTGWLGFLGFVLAFIGVTLESGGNFSSVTLMPDLAATVPDAVTTLMSRPSFEFPVAVVVFGLTLMVSRTLGFLLVGFATLRAVHVPDDHARITAEILTAASLRGVDTHGVGNVTGYVQAIAEGRYTIPQAVAIVAESPTTALLDGGNGLGFVAAHRAMEISIAKAKQYGVGMVSVRNGHHIGMVGYYPLMAVAQDMLGMAVTNASRAMRPAQGAHPRLGTNPIAFGAPAGKERPFLLDMATTTVASGKLSLARRLGVPIPAGWAVDSEGVPLTEPPTQRSEAWSQNPLGNTIEQGGHKGYGLAVMVDILAGVLSGGGFSAQLAGGENMTWTMAVDIAAFRPVAEFKAMMDALIQELHATPPEPGADRVLVAGDPEFDTEAERRTRGIPVHTTQYEAIVATARRVGAQVFI